MVKPGVEGLLDTLALCGFEVRQRRVGRHLIALCIPDPKKLTEDELLAVSAALTELGQALTERTV